MWWMELGCYKIKVTQMHKEKYMVLKRVNIYIWTVLVVAWCYDFLFWDKVPGISIPIFLMLMLIGGFFLARQQGLSPAKDTLWLLIPIIFFSIMSFVRLEPMTTFLNVAAALSLMGVMARSFLGGKWWMYTFKDYIIGSLKLGLDSLIRPIAILTSQPKEENEEGGERKKRVRTSLAIFRGLLLAIPVVLVFAGMLAEADPIFEQSLDDVLDFLKIENLGEYIGRGILISIIAYLLLGVYLHAFYKNHDEELSSEENRWIPRFLGFTEAAVVLASVNLLFLSFVIVQFQYFFGGQENIRIDGFTYAEYARRGFGELVTVAVFSLLLYIGLSVLTKKSEKFSQTAFSGLGIMLVALVIVILASSFKRLLLYEEVYGFTRLRTYTHVFIIWLGILLVAVILLEVFQRQRHFALAATLAALGFVATLDVINVDGMIVRQNLNRALRGETLDIAHLASLSEDAVPVLKEKYSEAVKNDELVKEITGVIACHAEMNDQYDYKGNDYRDYTWQSFHWSRFRAQQEWDAMMDTVGEEALEVFYPEGHDYLSDSYVLVNGVKVYCYSYGYGWE
jgi:hypothetical protein